MSEHPTQAALNPPVSHLGPPVDCAVEALIRGARIMVEGIQMAATERKSHMPELLRNLQNAIDSLTLAEQCAKRPYASEQASITPTISWMAEQPVQDEQRSNAKMNLRERGDLFARVVRQRRNLSCETEPVDDADPIASSVG